MHQSRRLSCHSCLRCRYGWLECRLVGAFYGHCLFKKILLFVKLFLDLYLYGSVDNREKAFINIFPTLVVNGISSVRHRLMSEHWRACLSNLFNMASVIIIFLLGEEDAIVDTGLFPLSSSSWR